LCLLRYAPQPQQRHEYSRRIGFLKTYKVAVSAAGEGVFAAELIRMAGFFQN
jgi:hypothetical protein